MASLESYIKERDEMIERGRLVITKGDSGYKPSLAQKNRETFYNNNGTHSSYTRYW